MQREDYGAAAPLCLMTGTRFGNDHDLEQAVIAAPRERPQSEIREICSELAQSTRAADAYNCLGEHALNSRELSQARVYAAAALVLHALAGNSHGIAKDLVVLSLVEYGIGDYSKSLGLAEEALGYSDQDSSMRSSAERMRATALLRLRRTIEAGQAAERARELSGGGSDWDLAWAYNALDVFYLEAGEAREPYSAEIERIAKRHNWSRLLSEAWNTRAWDMGREKPENAQVYLFASETLAGTSVDSLILHGQLAARLAIRAKQDGRGEAAAQLFADAGKYLSIAEISKVGDPDWLPTIFLDRAELAELLGLNSESIGWYWKAIARARALSLQAPNDPNLLTAYNEAYIALFSLFMRDERWLEAVSVVLAVGPGSVFDSNLATRTWDVDDVIAAWSTRDVVVVGATERDIGEAVSYRLRINHGKVSGCRIEHALDLVDSLRALDKDLNNAPAAKSVAAAIVPADASTSTLEVLGLGDLRIPVAALRDKDGHPRSLHQPLAQVMSLASDSPASDADGEPVVLANAAGNLPASDEEATSILRALSPHSVVYRGKEATSSHLFDARTAALVHISTHSNVWSNQLSLADRDVSPREIVAKKIAPRYAVLPSCASGGSTMARSWDSLAAAFLFAGTRFVIGSDRSVSDSAAKSLMVDLYGDPKWMDDPARALAAVQLRASLSEDEALRTAWPAFSVVMRPPYVAPRKVGMAGSVSSATASP